MTTNVCNRGIVHLAHRPGGDPFCKARRAHMTCTPAGAEGYTVCKRCAAKLEKMRAVAARRADREARAEAGPVAPPSTFRAAARRGVVWVDEIAPEPVAWCVFCKKDHPGGATCMGHHP